MNPVISRRGTPVLALSIALLVQACGGGGGDASSQTSNNNQSSNVDLGGTSSKAGVHPDSGL